MDCINNIYKATEYYFYFGFSFYGYGYFEYDKFSEFVEPVPAAA